MKPGFEATVQREEAPLRPTPSGFSGDAAALARDLASVVDGEVRFSAGDRALYATDASNYRQVPIGLVVPRAICDLVATVEVCHAHQVPLLPRGGGTSLAGQCCNTAVVVDTSKYLHGILELQPDRRRARVEPGVICDELRDVAAPFGLTWGPDPSTHDRCTIGGMVGNDSCGVHSVYSGRTVHNIEELEILTYDGLRLRVGPTSDETLEATIRGGGRRGQIYAGLKSIRDRYAPFIRAGFPEIPRRVSGYGLDQLLPENGFNVARALVGSEGTLVTVLEATCRLVDNPPGRSLVVLGYPEIHAASDHVSTILEHGVLGLEGLDHIIMANIRERSLRQVKDKLMPPGKGWLLAELGGEDRAEADEKARSLVAALDRGRNAPTAILYDDPARAKMVWAIREAGLAAAAGGVGGKAGWPGWEDSAVAPERLGPYIKDLSALMQRHGFEGAFYGHFGDGCLHCRLTFDLASRPGIRRYRAFVEDAAELVVSYGGSLSGEHGDGLARAELLRKMYGPELLQAFREFKAVWDPSNRMNPERLPEPAPLDSHLRLGPYYDPPPLETAFAFPDDGGSFAQSTLRCVGVGKCRRKGSGTMCPSYMATLEEKHSTRGRARLLFEMLEGDPLERGWREKEVKEALDLCLACKGCLGDCPVNVDMATYKAEFLSHYYHARLRPRAAYSMGLIHWWARLAARSPGLVNRVNGGARTGTLVKRVAGISREREFPRFAEQTFKEWFFEWGEPGRRRGPSSADRRPEVVLWPDTFTNHLNTAAGRAALPVLEAAGYRVHVPSETLCCGRPLYDWGMVALAKRLLVKVLRVLGPYIEAGVPVVGLEPSCAAVFRNELVNLFPDDERARKLAAQTYTLAEFLETAGWDPPRLDREVLVHGHCHHKAIMTTAAEDRLLSAMGVRHTVLDAGCCGMAGSFGFEDHHYELSVAAGERVLLPAVRAARPDTLIVADGFSCREQIAQLAGRSALHLAEVVNLALQEGGSAPPSETPPS